MEGARVDAFLAGVVQGNPFGPVVHRLQAEDEESRAEGVYLLLLLLIGELEVGCMSALLTRVVVEVRFSSVRIR